MASESPSPFIFALTAQIGTEENNSCRSIQALHHNMNGLYLMKVVELMNRRHRPGLGVVDIFYGFCNRKNNFIKLENHWSNGILQKHRSFS
jgi:hypothetical protein